MTEPFIDCTTPRGLQRVRGYVLGWLERLDYAGKLQRSWPEAELGQRIWDKIEREFAAVWKGPVVANRPLAELISVSMVEDYFLAYPERRNSRYSVLGPLPDVAFRRCVLDYLHDLEEFEPAQVPARPELGADAFWDAVRTHPERWGCCAERGPFVDDEPLARRIALEVLHEYFAMQHLLEVQRAESPPLE